MSSSIDPQRIRETYSAMSDSALIDFARHEGYKITADAFLVLREELRKRNIGADIVHYMEHEIILQDSLKRKKFSEQHKLNNLSDSVAYAFKQKVEGVSNFDIYAGLIEMGIPEQQAGEMVNQLEDWALELRKDATLEIQTGIGLVIVGLIAVLVALNIHFLVLGAILLLFSGVIRIMTGNSKRKRFDAVLTVFQQEKEDQHPDPRRIIQPH
ncbi:hypothetical protein [Paraflavitalea sp. CAU 1676]|uniref:hypothetical protein n=1 Tax=Paraflavitalea sp. CAU 1676 TaxID=3032598 RepID=UPI0023DC15A9|nr:hypothetical protein [Paraflavitalea sp. CAU 1676]MDF2189107.1 hypothetical protein [Paraflavitalea sp. CAU 1676]